MHFDPDLIHRLRHGMLQGRPLSDLVCMLRSRASGPMTSLAVLNYFMKAFNLRFPQVRRMFGALCLGGRLCTDEDMEEMLRKHIDFQVLAELVQAGSSAEATEGRVRDAVA